MPAFKNVALLEAHWGAIVATLESCGNDNDKLHAAMIREQLSGDIKVVANSKTVKLKAPRGGDLRAAVLLGGSGGAAHPTSITPGAAVVGGTPGNAGASFVGCAKD